MIDNLNYREIKDNPKDCYITFMKEGDSCDVGVVLPDGEICGAKMGITEAQAHAHAAELKALTGLPYPSIDHV